MGFRVSDDEFNVEFMRMHGYVRKRCKGCNSYFWTVNEDAEYCGDSPCVYYDFIENPPTRRSYSIQEMRNAFLKFFERNGHEVIDPYPVVARWRDDLMITIASIVDFQPYVTEGIVDPPANPLVISQPCLRFEDLENVGFTFGRHLTIFEMGGAHAFNFLSKPEVYWKNETIDFHHRFATEELGIPEEYITYKEHFWSGGGNAGPDVEGSILGLEVSTLVFMKYKVLNGELTPLPVRTVDTGYGIERWTWLSQGTYSGFKAIYEGVLETFRKVMGIDVDKTILRENSIVSGFYTYRDPEKARAMRMRVAEKLGLSLDDLEEKLRPYEDMCIALDHSKALIFLISDGAVPSNVREGYLSRLLFRRMYRVLMKYGVADEMNRLIKAQIDYWGAQFKKIKEMEDELFDILLNEKKKYLEAVKKGVRRLSRLIEVYKRKKIVEMPVNDLIELYDSHGLHPEFVKDVAEQKGFRVKIPVEFSSMVAKKHEGEGRRVRRKGIKVDIGRKFETERLYYRDQYSREFEARVLYSDGRHVILSKTLFYPTGGGQMNDVGLLVHEKGEAKVVNVEEINGNIIHLVEGKAPEVGAVVKGAIDWDRRYSLMKNHDATHIILGAARRVLGNHIWQAGAEKDPEKVRLDITHHKRISREELEEIEKLANKVVMENLPIEIFYLKRTEAERKYGVSIYQGGAVPTGVLRIVKIGKWDVEACGGLHCKSTRELFFIKVLGTERIQDGVERIVFTSGENALKSIQEMDRVLEEISIIVGETREKLTSGIKALRRKSEKLKVELRHVKNALISEIARRLVNEGESIGSVKLIVYEAVKGMNLEDLIKTGKEIGKMSLNHVYIGYIVERGVNGVIMLGEDAVNRGLSAREMGKLISEVIEGGFSGGREFARFGGKKLEADLKEVVKSTLRFRS